MKSKTKGLLCGGLVVAACASLVCGLNRLRLNVGAEGNIVTMREGASCFLYQDDAEKSGLKFFACVNRDDYNEFETAYGADRVSAGMLLAPLSGIGSAELTKETKEVSDVSVPKEKFKAVTEGGLQRYEFCGTAEEIAEENYTDEYAARAYIKITAAEDTAALSGYPYSDGSFYIYSDYNAAYARSVYSVSYRAYNDRADSQSAEYGNEVSFQENTSYSKLDEEQRNSLKSRLDKVIGVWEKDGNAYLDTDYYSSPFESVSANGSVVVLPENKPYSGMAYNGRPVTDFAETGKKVSLAKKGGELTLTESGGLQTTKKLPAGTSAYEASVWSRYYNYIAFTGDYGVGTYLDFEFTGDRMPQVMFFANDDENGFGKKLGENYGAIAGYGDGNGAGAEHGQWTANGAKGLLLLNALQEKGGYFQAFGPNRMFGDVDYGQTGRGELFTLNPGTYSKLSAKNLKSDTLRYAYTIGTFLGKDQKVGVDILLKEAQTKEEVYHIRVSTGLTAQEVGSGHVIVYPPFDEADVACSFDLISAPYLYDPTDKEYTVAPVTYKGAQLTEDGGLQTTKKLPAGTSAYEASVWSRYYNYIAFTGDYGVGTYLDFEFTGDRMPQVMFFANDDENGFGKKLGENYGAIAGYGDGNGAGAEHGQWTANGAKGVLLLSALKETETVFQAFGPNRMFGDVNFGESGRGELFTLSYSAYPLFSSKGLRKMPSGKFNYTVGTFTGTDRKVGIELILKDATTKREIYHVRKSLNLTAEEVGSGHIIVYPPFNEADVSCTIDAVSDPYRYEPSDKSYLDPSATLAGKGFFADPNHASNIRVAEFGHIGFEGNYGVGTYIEFEFTGNNMPDVVLFADEIDGHKTAGERTTDGGKESFDYGMLLTAGLGPCNDVTAWSSEKIYSANYLVYGMIRSGWGWEYGGESHGYTECINAKLLGTGATYTYEDYPLLTHAGLKDNDDTFKYTVGTKYNADGNIVVVVSLMKMNFATGEWEEIENAKGAKYTDLEITTGFKEADIKGTNIIVQAPAVAGEWETTVSFRYREPFTLS